MRASNKNSSAVLGKRLMSAVKYVRQGAVFADIGTDHAYLPIYLLNEGLIERAVLSDINEGPLSSARANAAEAGVLDRVELVLTDGAAALWDKGITDVAVFGMGGELIAEIIEAAPFLKSPEVRLILQPMTKVTELCEYLLKSGFSVIGESYSAEGGKFYRTLCVEYGEGCAVDGERFPEIGFTDTPCEETEAKIGYLSAHLASRERAILGKRSASLDAREDTCAAEIIKEELVRLGSSDLE